MKTLLFIAVFINLGLTGFWALLGDVENAMFAGACSALCWLGFIIRSNGEEK